MIMQSKKKLENQNKFCRLQNSHPVIDPNTVKDLISVHSSDDLEFSVDLSSLKAQSDFFLGLFNSGMKEIDERVVRFPTLTGVSLKQTVDFITKGHLIIGQNDFHLLAETVASATYLQISDLISEAIRTMKDWLATNTYDEIVDICKHYDLIEAENYAIEWSLSNGSEYIKSGSFKNLPFEDVLQYTSDDRLYVKEEFEVFVAVNTWIENHKDISNGLSLFDNVRFELINGTSLKKCSDICSKYGEKATDLLTRIEKLQNSYTCPETSYLQLRNSKARCMKDFVVAVGGFRTTERSSNLMQLIPLNSLVNCKPNKKEQFSTNDKLKLPTILCEHSIAVLDNDIYVAGGQTRYCQNGKHTTNKVYRFNVCVQNWIEVKEMNVTRSLFYLCSLESKLFAIMGWLEPDKVTKSVEMYEPKTNTWKLLQSLDVGVHEHGGCTHNGHIYVSGGYKGPLNGHLDRAWRFTPPNSTTDLGQWTEIARMNKRRSYHVMCAFDDYLLVAGGVQYIRNQDSMENIRECEVYSISLNQWSVVGSIPYVGSCMDHVLIGDELFMFGGHCFNDDSKDTIHRNLQVLNIKSWEWRTTEYTANKVNFFACDVVRLPKNLALTFNKKEEK